MKKSLTFVFFFLFAITSFSQKIYQRKKEPLVDLNGHYKLGGWQFAPGLTYTLTRFKNKEETLYNANDTLYNTTFDPGGRLGLYFEFGRYKIFKYGTWINYMDYSLAFKQIKGKEKFEGEMLQESSSTAIMTTDGKGKFGYSYLTGNFNLNNIIQISDYRFIQNSIGINADYRLITNTKYEGNTVFQQQNTPTSFMAQLHYKIGYGIKWNDKLFIIPSLETPILNLYEWDNFKSSFFNFSSRYRPLIFTIRIAWLKKSNGLDCPPVYGNPDDKMKQQQYQQQK